MAVMNIQPNCERFRLLRGRSAGPIKKPVSTCLTGFEIRCRQLAIFPRGLPLSIFTSMSLYDRVRDDSAEQND